MFQSTAPESVRPICASPDGSIVVAGGVSGKVYVWDVGAGFWFHGRFVSQPHFYGPVWPVFPRLPAASCSVCGQLTTRLSLRFPLPSVAPTWSQVAEMGCCTSGMPLGNECCCHRTIQHLTSHHTALWTHLRELGGEHHQWRQLPCPTTPMPSLASIAPSAPSLAVL